MSSLPTVAVVLLGLVALGSLVQAAFLIVLAREAVRAFSRLDQIGIRLGDALRPLSHDLARATSELATASEITAGQIRTLSRVTSVAADRMGQARDAVDAAVMPALSRLGGVLAIVGAVRRAVDVYRARRA